MSQPTSRADLSPDQQRAYDTVLDWCRNGETRTLTLGGYAGCLSGDTALEYSRGSRAGVRPISLRDLYLKFNGHSVPGVRGISNRWVDLTMPTFLHSLWPDGTVSRNRIIAVFESGVKSVIRVDFSDGSHLVLTKDHPIAVSGGDFVAAGDLRKGDKVLARGSMKASSGEGRQIDQRPPRIVVNVKYHPGGAYKGVLCNGVTYEYTRVPRARLVVEAAMNNVSYEEYVHALKHNPAVSTQFKYLPDDVDVHHLDEDPLNDDIGNLEALPHAEHARVHAAEENLHLEYVREVRIKRIRDAGKAMTYDIQMDPPANNFAANGIFVHNTGKTSLMGVFALAGAVSPIAFVAYTGKAASVLGRKLRGVGVSTTNKLKPKNDESPFGSAPYCGTIHSLIYMPCDCIRPRLKHELPVERPCEFCGEARFVLREALDRPYGLIVVDEASMVSDDMLRDLRVFETPILAVGDHGQLPPVKGIGGLMRSPQIRLERIHRQAEKNPIIALSKAIRETGDFDARMADGKAVRFGRMRDLGAEITRRLGGDDPALFDQAMISYTNKRRVGLNSFARQALGRKGPPVEGEQVICLRNMKAKSAYNGMRGVLEGAAVRSQKQPWIYEAQIAFPEEGVPAQTFAMCSAQFNREKTIDDPLLAREEYGIDVYSWEALGALFDFGYALTCHKAQGSGWEDVLVAAETWGMDPDTTMRWRYTAVTRASERLTVLR